MTDVVAPFAAFLAGEKSAPKSAPVPPPVTGDAYAERVKRYIEGIAGHQAMLTKGNRNAREFGGAKDAFRYASGAGLPESWVEDLIYRANERNGQVAEDGEHQVRTTIASARREAAAAGPDYLTERDRGGGGTIQPAYTIDPADVKPPKLTLVPAVKNTSARIVDIESIEHDFWERPNLKHIRDAALGRMCAPWAVLAHCAARALAFVPTTARLPPLIGGDEGGSLNWYAVAVDRSGGGKSAAAAVAKSLVPHSADTRHLGSGEGLVECYWPAFEPPKDGDEEFANTHPRAFVFQADEIDTIGALGARTGQTLLPHLRTAFTGGSIGAAYRGRTKQNIPDQQYRLTLVVSAQPRRCATILADTDGGTPQRFMWFPANDPRISARNAKPLEPIAALKIATEYLIGRYISIPETAQDLILEQCELRGRGVGGAIDGHSVFCREKFAYALAVLDGRNQMSDDDWYLSGIAAAVSDATREWAVSCVADSAAEDAEERGRLLGVSSAASDDEKAHRSAGRAKRIGQSVVAKLTDGPMTEGELRRSLASRDRPWLPGALQALQVADLVGVDGEKRLVLK